MNAADFRREVDAELEQLRRAHVVAGVEVATDIVVGVKLSLDGRPYNLTSQVRNSDERRAAFEQSLRSLRHFRGRHTPPALQPAVRRRMPIPVERHVAETSWAALMFFAFCLALVIALGWLFDVELFPRGETSGRQRRPGVGLGTTAGKATARRAGSVVDDPGEFVDRAGCRSVLTRTSGAGRSRTL